MQLRKILKDIQPLNITGDVEKEINNIVFNSKLASPNSLFVALKGTQHDGISYVSEAISKGAVAILAQEYPVPRHNGITYIQASDVRKTAALLAAAFYQHPAKKLNLMGITGTNGKTTTSYLIASILKEAGRKTGIIGTINYQYGNKTISAFLTTPESLDIQRLFKEMVTEGVSHVVMEVSSHALFYKRVAGCQFQLAIFTNLSQDHLDFHKDMEAYFACKKQLFTHYLGSKGKAIINLDDPYGKRILEEIKCPCITYGLSSKADIWTENFQISINKTTAYIHTPIESFSICSPLIGKPNLYNILAAAAAGIAMDLPINIIKTGIEKVSSICGRLERFSQNGIEVLVDYAHTPDALEQVLKTLRPLCQGRLITVFGCGGNRDKGKRPLMGKIASELSDMVIITDDNPRNEPSRQIIQDIEMGIKKNALYYIIPKRPQAIAMAINTANRGDVVVIAGKGHEDYQIVGNKKYPLSDREEVKKALKNAANRELEVD